MLPKVQHGEYLPTLAICHATMQVRPFRLTVYRTAGLPTEFRLPLPGFQWSRTLGRQHALSAGIIGPWPLRGWWRLGTRWTPA
jgi:hypothetical protein